MMMNNQSNKIPKIKLIIAKILIQIEFHFISVKLIYINNQFKIFYKNNIKLKLKKNIKI